MITRAKSQPCLQAHLHIQFFFYCSSDHHDLHSFPTRRSSVLLLNWLTIAPAKAFGLKKAGRIAINQPADIAIFNLEQKVAINSSDFKSKARNTPFNQDLVFGQTELTMVDGKIVFQREESK